MMVCFLKIHQREEEKSLYENATFRAVVNFVYILLVYYVDR